jgi:hypothetical protein
MVDFNKKLGTALMYEKRIVSFVLYALLVCSPHLSASLSQDVMSIWVTGRYISVYQRKESVDS